MRVVCVSAGMQTPKKGNESYRKKQRYLNYGLLSLASMINDETRVYHGEFSDPCTFLETLSVEVTDCQVVLLSIPSFYALAWAETFSHCLARRYPWIQLHIGGRWVVDNNRAYLQQKFPTNAYLHEGLGENKLLELTGSVSIHGRSPLIGGTDYSKLDGFQRYNPSIEVSRGCGMGCHFCQEANVPLSPLKNPNAVVEECENAALVYGYSPNFYFEASFFAPGQKWIDDLANARSRSSLPIVWRTETRADAIPAKRLPSLYDAGLRYLDIGLESADPIQLNAMQKTKDAVRYLDRASELLEACEKIGVRCKVNILLYPGETVESIERTTSWLQSMGASIYGVSAYPVLLFGLGNEREHLQLQYRNQGATGFQDIGIEGIEGVNLSPTMTHGEAQEYALGISRKFMTKAQYFNLKSYSYFDPSYTFQDFSEDIVDIEECRLPFQVN